MGSDAPALDVRGLTVRAGGRTLLDGADLRVERGEVVLLAGPSGAGKTVLLRLLAGLVRRGTPGFRLNGRLSILGKDILAAPGAARGKVGIVFQDHALFTDLTSGGNVAFALDHRRPKLSRTEAAATRTDLLEELGIPGDARMDELSGGQRQRVAIARALAYRPEILAYDEPTSGLDPALRDRVGALIRRTNLDHGVTTIVVTHDLPGLLEIADRVYLLEPESGRLVETSPEEAPARLAGLLAGPSPARAPRTVGRRLLRGADRFLEGSTRTMEGLGAAMLHLIPRWPSPRWGARFTARYLRVVAGPGALLYFLLAGAVIGLVATYFTFTFLPYRPYTEGLIMDDLVGALGFGLHRILLPLLVSILLAARCGAAVSADVATRVAGHQDDAMRSLGARPSRYLLTGNLWAFLLGTPAVAVVAFLGASAASACVFAVLAPDVSLHGWSAMFHRLLSDPGALLPAGSDWVAAKYLAGAFGIAAISWFQGARPKTSPEDVARAITRTVIWATVLVLAIHTAFALIEF